MKLPRIHALKAQLLFALAHPTRIAILEELRGGELSVGQVAERLGLRQANCSQHLSILRAQQIVSRRKSANQVYYTISDGAGVRLLDELDAYVLSHVSRRIKILSQVRAKI